MIRKAVITLLIAAFGWAAICQQALAEESKFRKSFRTSYEQNRFDALGFLVRTNRDKLPGEIQSLIDEARAAESFPEKMVILDLANAMATMHKEWHGVDTFLPEIEKMQKEEIKKEESRKAEIEKWERYESFPGNLLMKAKAEELEAIGLSPVIFPHWVHRINFECKACHQELFQMKRSDAITMTEIFEGKLCGACHNGKVAFDAAESCEMCHVAGKPEAEPLVSPKKADMKNIKATADRLGTGLDLDLLPNNKLPFDKFGNIDWTLLRKAQKQPIKSIKKDPPTDETRDNEILFESPVPFVSHVVFSHKKHSEMIVCSSCHQEVFREDLGSSRVNMTEMSRGASCGACHGKVSFKFADCKRCHSKPAGETAGGMLLRKKR
ncbi:MAG: hypothetical protein A2V21_302075 [Deltaproteobacteria bacterium GWC2_55_46]|nr:MAG: hypothetical protein A2Z79_06590 [Deltaproteobacteria bacterium GWA2_55_82]OGQ63317.1 MAG: hypothetical protein A3I81_01010 [Deltaproteobacteria bacterium RIFCSPLOWO2_02_FULL_55_12]OIJ73153.1 MAG: hypothetical protein A2V21_302075 [Deltaproteobacteria bacterium GWC2_55_46]